MTLPELLVWNPEDSTGAARQLIDGQPTARIEAKVLCRGTGASWPEEPDILAGVNTLALHSIGFAARLAMFYRNTALVT